MRNSLFSLAGEITARSLAEAYQVRREATRLILKGHTDLTCQNIMCEKFGNACACRLAVRLGHMPLLRHIDISRNGLDVLPDSLFELTHLHSLHAQGNRLRELPNKIVQLTNLEELLLDENQLEELPVDSLIKLPNLKRISITGNFISKEKLEEYRTMIPIKIDYNERDG